MKSKPLAVSSVVGLISFSLLCVSILFIVITVVNLSKSEDYQPLTISRLHRGQISNKLIKQHSYLSTFKAFNNNLGTVSFRFDTTKHIKSGLLLFRLKEQGAKKWYYENTYRTDQFMNNGLFPFGFPPISNSQGKIYEVELTFQIGTDNNYLMISNPQYVTKYAYTRGNLHSMQDVIFIGMTKIQSILGNMNLLDYIIVISPFLIYLILLRYRPKYLEWFAHQWVTFLMDLVGSISFIRLSKWKRRYELAVVLLFIVLFISSLLTIKNSGQPIKWGMMAIIGLLLIFLSRKIYAVIISLLKQGGLIAVLLIHLAIKASVFHTLPNWDGRLYFYWINDQITAFNINFSNYGEKFSLFGHPAQGYMSYLAIGRALFGTSYISIHILNTILGLATITAFYAICKRIYKLDHVILILLTLIFALNPLFIANSLTPNLDYPGICFFAIALFLLIYDKLILSTFFWILLAFSKETGLLLYGLLIFFELLLSFFGKSIVVNTYLTRLKLQTKHVFFLLFGYFIYIIFPFLIFAFNYFMRSQRVWQPNYYVFPHNPIVLNFEIIFTRFVESFILNFQWVILLLIIISLIKHRRMVAPFSLVLTTFAFYIVMALYNTFLHPRYIVPLHFLFLLGAAPFINTFTSNKRFNYFFLIFLSLFLLIQNYLTIDVLTMKLLGTFRWGTYALIKIGDSAQSRCDGSAYNTQHTHITSLYKELHQRLGNAPYSIIVNDLEGNLQSNRWVQQYGYSPLILIDELKKTIPQGNVYYVFMPWLTNNKDYGLREVKKYYSVGEGKIVNQNGYWLRYYKLGKLIQ